MFLFIIKKLMILVQFRLHLTCGLEFWPSISYFLVMILLALNLLPLFHQLNKFNIKIKFIWKIRYKVGHWFYFCCFLASKSNYGFLRRNISDMSWYLPSIKLNFDFCALYLNIKKTKRLFIDAYQPQRALSYLDAKFRLLCILLIVKFQFFRNLRVILRK